MKINREGVPALNTIEFAIQQIIQLLKSHSRKDEPSTQPLTPHPIQHRQ